MFGEHRESRGGRPRHARWRRRGARPGRCRPPTGRRPAHQHGRGLDVPVRHPGLSTATRVAARAGRARTRRRRLGQQTGPPFHNEARAAARPALARLLPSDPPTCWSIIDARIAAEIQRRRPLLPRRRRADLRDVSFSELLDYSPSSQAVRQLRSWPSGRDSRPGRSVKRSPATTDAGQRPGHRSRFRPTTGSDSAARHEPPFYAIQFFPLARKNLGGVRTDLDCACSTRHDLPIPGLFAAGEVAGIAGGRINGRAGLEGTMIGPASTAAESACRAAPHELDLDVRAAARKGGGRERDGKGKEHPHGTVVANADAVDRTSVRLGTITRL